MAGNVFITRHLVVCIFRLASTVELAPLITELGAAVVGTSDVMRLTAQHAVGSL